MRRNEPVTVLLLPMRVISGLVSRFRYPGVCRQRERAGRADSLDLGFVLSTVVYGGYLWVFIPDGRAWSLLLALVAGHLDGLPLFFAVLVTRLLLSPLVVPHAVGGSQ